VLDDLHRADEPTLALLSFLVQTVADAPILIVGTYRDASADDPGALHDTLGELRRASTTSVLTLQGLEKADIPQLVLACLGGDQLAEKLHELTGGNPLELKHRLLPLTKDTDLVRFEEQLEAMSSIDLREVIESRLNEVPRHVRDLLDVASVIGGQFSAEVLAHSAEQDLRSVRAVLAEAIGFDLVEQVPAFRRYRFSHFRICEVLYDNLGRDRQAELHHAVGQALEVVYASELESRVQEVAYHFAQAAGESGSPEALDYLHRAAQRAQDLLAYREAERWLTMALGQPAADRARRCELLLALAGVQMKTGAYATARLTYLQAADTAKALGDPERFAQAALGYGTRIDSTLVNQQFASLLQEAVGLLVEPESSLRDEVLARLEMAVASSGLP
jgi:predicted ATPase